MLTYRAMLRPLSAMRSPWQADVLFGHLCWLIRYEEGEQALGEFLEPFRQGTPPLVFSNGFPGDDLPKPLVPRRADRFRRTKAAQVAIMEAATANKAIDWISLEQFNQLRRGEQISLERRSDVKSSRTVLKNQINRLTGGTTPVDDMAGGGNLYNVEELAFVDRAAPQQMIEISIYVRVADATWARRAEDLLRRLAKSGYGAKKSAGYGHFEVTSWTPFTGFDEPLLQANGFIGLSHWVPARTDPTNGFYQTFIKYGKLGEELANSENPFKFPLLMLTAGSTFYVDGPVQEWYGRLVEHIAPGDPRIVHYGYAFVVPAHCVEG
jgi:CRISPR-associated protein Csm4